MKSKHIYAFLKKTALVLLISFVLGFCAGCTDNSDEIFSAQDFVMDTILSQKIYFYQNNAQIPAGEVLSLLKTQEKLFSAFDEDSEIYKVNSSAGKPVCVSENTFELVEKSLGFCKESKGVFDVSVLALSSLWKTAIDSQKLPSDSEISAKRQLVDFNKITLDAENLSITVPSGMGLDLGAVAKGYVLNEIKAVYREYSVYDAICSIGSSAMLLWGDKAGEGYKIGLKNPFEKNGTQSFATLKLENCAVSTSGGYERYAEIDGKMYHHIIDVKTGKPSLSDIASVTVVSDDGVFCDYMSTRLFVEGFETAQKTVLNENVSAVIVTQDKKVFVSDTLSEKIEITDSEFERFLKDET